MLDKLNILINFCKHSELWPKYKELTEKSLKITILDKALWSVDSRYKDLNWNFFNESYFLINYFIIQN